MPDGHFRAGLTFGSVCSGIEAASVAWQSLGWRCAFMSEIAAFPRAVLTHRFPDVPLHGDFTTIKAGTYDAINLLVGGTPCQSFSIAGLRGGLADERGNLALEYLRLADRLRPRWLVWENVPGVLSSRRGRDFGAFLGALGEIGYGFAYRVLDAQYFGLAQRRARVFVVGCLGDWRRAAAVLFEPASLRGDSAPGRRSGATVAAFTARGVGTCGADDNQAQAGHLIAFSGGNTTGPIDVSTTLTAHAGGRMDFDSETFVAPVGFHGSQNPIVSNDVMPPIGRNQGQECCALLTSGVRRLIPRECERLQGFPDDYTLVPYRGRPAADGPRYAAIGNSMAVPVMRWIGARLAAQHAEVEVTDA